MRFAISFACIAAALAVSVALADDKPKEKEKEKDKAKDVPALVDILKKIDEAPDKAKLLKGEKYSFIVEIASYSSEDHRNKAKVDAPFTVLLHFPRPYVKGDRVAVTGTIKTITWEAKNKRVLFDPVSIDEEISITPPQFTAAKFMQDYLGDVYRNSTRMKDSYEGRSIRLTGQIESATSNAPGSGPGAPAGGPPGGGPGMVPPGGGGPGRPGAPGGAGGGRPGGAGGVGFGPPGGGGNPGPPPGGGGNPPAPGSGPGGKSGPSVGDYYLLKQQIQMQNGQSGYAMIIVRFADDADGKPVAPANRSNVKVEGVVENMSGMTITIRDAKIVK